MRWGLDISQHQLMWDEIVSRAHLAEEAGLDGVWAFDQLNAHGLPPSAMWLGDHPPLRHTELWESERAATLWRSGGYVRLQRSTE
ncbi:MAG: LLM class flavin-dependent oxidoreductase, partial [Actinomycetota bacterium]|nr:LLM class flavin-dependent oxidoreductase [Actinomycetota bacterium]